MEEVLSRLETLLNMYTSQLQNPYWNMMTILKAAPGIRLLNVGGVNMWECVNVFFPGWTDIFPLLPKPCCVSER